MEQFLRQLASALSNELPQDEVESNVRYYRDYINKQKASGKSESEVLNDLGDPNLIARSIIDADKISGRKSYNFNYNTSDVENEKQYNNRTYSSNVEYNNRSRNNYTSRVKDRINSYSCGGSCLKIVAILILILLLIMAVISVIFHSIWGIFKFLLFGGPVVAIVLIILLVIYLGRKR